METNLCRTNHSVGKDLQSKFEQTNAMRVFQGDLDQGIQVYTTMLNSVRALTRKEIHTTVQPVHCSRVHSMQYRDFHLDTVTQSVPSCHAMPCHAPGQRFEFDVTKSTLHARIHGRTDSQDHRSTCGMNTFQNFFQNFTQRFSQLSHNLENFSKTTLIFL